MGLKQDQITLVSISALAATVNSPTFNLSGYTSGGLYLNLPTISGTTPILTPVLQTSIDGTNWFTVPAGSFAGFAATSGTTAQAQYVPFLIAIGLALCRFQLTVSGTTPSFTGSIVGILNHP
jgi:hypothetical protein